MSAPSTTRVVRWPLWAVMAVVPVLMIAGAAWAWACVPQAQISLLRSFGAPGTELTVEGDNFEEKVELRWNAIDGPLLASAPSGSFSVPVVLPEGPDGLYVLVALERAPGGALGNVARAPVQLARGASSSSTTIPPADTESSSSTAFAVTLGIAGALALLGVGAIAGYRLARRRQASTAQPNVGSS